ncbi:MAG TPA: lipopolysaccharide biosynthesis protein [Thermoguttaceae bacterium]|nr:lipopolysaccharide biosynthesis protein [Thermoguttaceae bacterium]
METREPLETGESTLPPPADDSIELGPSPEFRADTLADSVVILLSLTVLQRGIGFVRSVLFCRWLPEEQLGQWDIAFGFLMLAAPLSMLSLPSCLSRYLEYYRQRGQARTLIARVTLATVVLAIVSGVILFVGREPFSLLIFGTVEETGLVALLAVVLVITVATHFLVELLNALRYVRVLSVVHLVNSLVFAVLGTVLVLGYAKTATNVVLAYTGACVLSSLGAVWYLRSTWRAMPRAVEPIARREFWGKILPYVRWIWLTSLMANLFVIADRYMIIHFAHGGPEEGLKLVGQYHSSRVIPLLLVSIATLLGTMITPHLSHDWETGRRDRVGLRLNLFMKLLALGLAFCAVLVVLGEPILFDWVYKGKFDVGREVLPCTLAYSLWFGITLASQNYLLCAEKGRWGSLALLAALVLNIGLNVFLLPRYGLPGAVWSTTIANLLALGLMFAFNRMLGMPLDPPTLAVVLAPGLLCFGGAWSAWALLALIVAFVILAPTTRWVLNADEKQLIGEALGGYLDRFRRLVRRA